MLQLLMLFVTVSVGLFLVSIFLIFIPKVNETFDQLRNESDRTAVETVASTIKQYILDRKLALEDIANHPLVSSAVLLGSADNPAFQDYITHVLLLGENSTLTVLDVRGNVLLTEGEEENYQWARSIIDRNIEQILNIVYAGEQPQFELAIPVRYRSGKEGILISRFSAAPEKIFPSTKKENISFAVAYAKDGKHVRSHVEGIAKPHEESIQIEDYNLEVTQITDRQNILEQKSNLLNEFGINTFCLAGIAFVILFLIGKKIILHPYEILDITKGALQQANKELEEFTYRTSHDLKAPLLNIRGLSSFMKEDLESKSYEEVAMNIDRVNKITTRLETLVDDMADASQVDRESDPYKETNVELFVDTIKENLEILIREYQVEVQVESDGSQRMWLPNKLMTRVLENLVSNGIKFSDPEKTHRFVKVKFLETSEAIHIEVIDNGLGIPEKYHDQVFGIFKRFHESKSFGSGLGLYLVKKNINKIRGDITLESSPEGSVFKIRLPLFRSATQFLSSGSSLKESD